MAALKDDSQTKIWGYTYISLLQVGEGTCGRGSPKEQSSFGGSRLAGGWGCSDTNEYIKDNIALLWNIGDRYVYITTILFWYSTSSSASYLGTFSYLEKANIRVALTSARDFRCAHAVSPLGYASSATRELGGVLRDYPINYKKIIKGLGKGYGE